MNPVVRIREEQERAVTKKHDLNEKLKQLEEAEPKNFRDIWMTRDQIAYWQGMAEGLQFALDELREVR